MRMRRGGMDRLIRRFIAGTALIMLMLVSGRFAGRAAGTIMKNNWKRVLETGGGLLVEAIWNRSNPVLEPSVAMERERLGDENQKGGRDPDPSYRNFQSAKEFYAEHQYLAFYGGEETGQQSLEDGAAAVSQGQGVPPANGADGAGGNNLGGAQDIHTSQGGGSQGAGPGVIQAAVLTGITNRPIIGNTYVLEQLMDYDFLMKHFYSVHTSTTAGRDLMDAKKLLEIDTSIQGDNSKPQILIYHTHSQEAYADSGPGQNVVGVGDYLTQLLEAKGYNVYHDKSVYDLRNGELDRSKAYNYALDGVAGILQKYPSIEVVLDIHRDGVGKDLRLVSQVDGKDTAQIMFFNGLSQTPEGPIEYLQNPYREANLAFSLKMQLNAAAYYPGYTRKIYLKGLRYNEHLRPKSSLVEVGAQTNTYQEALNAMEPLAELLDMVLQGNKKNDMIQ